MLRLSGQCLLLLLFASCGAIILNRVTTGTSKQMAAPFIHPDVYKEVRLRPVSLRDFRKQLSETRSYYDLMRIFFDHKRISNKEIDEMLTARTRKPIIDHVQIREMPSVDDYTDHHYPEYDDYALQDTGTYVVEDLLKAYDHIEEMVESPLGRCKYPQPEITHVKAEGDSKAKLFFPECTVVYRCRNVSGCCQSSSEVCGPKSLEVITKSFFVMEMTGPDLVRPDEVRMVETRDFINHTECECKPIAGLPGCDKECPVPFERMRPGLKCTCDCNEANENCLDIKYGIKPLEEEMLMGLKEKLYLIPECEKGEFDIKSGYCPHQAFVPTHMKRHQHHRAKGHLWKRNRGKKHSPKEKQKTGS